MSDEAHVQPEQPQPRGITRITVQGFKSLRDETSIEIRPLTILAGANSSGKSSIMQPLLLMKQTLEAPYDPGALLLHGTNVRFTRSSQFLSAYEGTSSFTARIDFGNNYWVANNFSQVDDKPIDIAFMEYVEPGMNQPAKLLLEGRFGHYDEVSSALVDVWVAVRDRCFLKKDVHDEYDQCTYLYEDFRVVRLARQAVLRIIHLSGFRGDPARSYNRAELNQRNTFVGRFEDYTASIVSEWQADAEALNSLIRALTNLGLTSSIQAKGANETEVELVVGNLPERSSKMFSIADVGFGVSQVLPVVVALLVAEPGQLVYIEQPELHLHPRAQAAMAGLLADAAKRGVRVVIETHSSILLLAIQTLIAEQQLDHNLVAMHWFSRDPDSGVTKVDSHFPDETGSLGDWPEDFDETELYWQRRYARASNARLREQQAKGRLAQNNGSNGSNGSHEADVGDIAAQSESVTQAAD